MIKYRPFYTGITIDEATAKEKTFESVEEMFDYVAGQYIGRQISKEDLSIGDNIGGNQCIGWKETRQICTRRQGGEVFDIPKCIGMCSFESEVHTRWTQASTDPNHMMMGLISCIEAGKNAWIEVRKNGDQELPLMKKNPLLDDPFNWQFNYGVPRNEKELADENFFNDTEKDLTYNWVAAFGTKEAVEKYQKDGTVTAELFTGMGVATPVRITDANYYRKEILKDGYEHGYWVDHWKPKDDIPRWVVDESIEKVFVICYTNDPVYKKEAIMRAGKFLINYAEGM